MISKNISHRLVLTSAFAMTALAFSCNGSMGASGVGDVPPGIVKGARFTRTFHGAGAIVLKVPIRKNFTKPPLRCIQAPTSR